MCTYGGDASCTRDAWWRRGRGSRGRGRGGGSVWMRILCPTVAADSGAQRYDWVGALRRCKELVIVAACAFGFIRSIRRCNRVHGGCSARRWLIPVLGFGVSPCWTPRKHKLQNSPPCHFVYTCQKKGCLESTLCDLQRVHAEFWL
jgi:hypothetical protein